MSRNILYLALTLPAMSLISGCGGDPKRPEVVPVEGYVTMDGSPLADAFVSFEPATSGRGASGNTDDQGHFDLSFARKDGCPPGNHIVRITTKKAIVDEFGSVNGMRPETVPVRYNEETELTAEVTYEGDNNFTFDLTSNGETEQEE